MPPVDLSQFGLQPLGLARAGTAVALPPTGARMPGTPSPAMDPRLWCSFKITTKGRTFDFPPVWGLGTAVVKCESILKVDKQTASGKNKAKLKISGREPIPVTIAITWWGDAWERPGGVDEMLTTIDTNSPEAGGPFAFEHPDFQRRGGKAIQIAKVGEVAWNSAGTKGTCTITADEFDAAAQKTGAVSGTKVPKKATAAPVDNGAAAGGDNGAAAGGDNGTVVLYKNGKIPPAADANAPTVKP